MSLPSAASAGGGPSRDGLGDSGSRSPVNGSASSSAGSELIADRYQVVARLGGGELSDVYKVRDQIANRTLALKTTRPGVSREEELSLSREFYHLSRFNHPNVISVRDFGTTSDGRHYFTMEFFDGRPINEFFGTAPGTRLELSDAVLEDLSAVMIQVLEALDTIHCQGLLHCDIKPQNILVALEPEPPSDDRPDVGAVNGKRIADSGRRSADLPLPRVRAKLLDFGFAERFALSNSREARGTLGYIAPEVFKGTGLDARSDIYSLGMVVYELLTGQGPSEARDLLSWLRLQNSGQLTRPSERGVVLPARFEEMLWRMIQSRKDDRPHSCLEIIETLSPGTGIRLTPSDSERAAGEGAPQNYLLASGFVGRGDYLSKLSELLSGAARGQGSLVFVSGERGVGKSRLVTEFKFLAQLEGALVYPFTPASMGARPQSLLESLIRYLKDYHRVDVAAGIDGTDAPRLTPDASRPTQSAIDPPPSAVRSPQSAVELDPAQHLGEAEKFRLFETVAGHLRRLAGSEAVRHSFLLLLDDFELFDATSLEFMRYLVSSVERERIMVVVAGLNERRLLELISEFKIKPFVQHFAVPNLSPDETRDMTGSVLGPIPQLEELCAWLHEATGGNPLFVTEVIYSLIDQGILRLSASRWSVQVEALWQSRTPETVAEVIKRRLKRLAPDEMKILRTGAISGAPLTVEFLRVVLGYDERQLFSAVSRLKAMGLMRPYVGDVSSSLIPTSKMLESVVLETISAAERRESHRRVALALELLYPDDQERLIFDLAHHYTQAGIKERAYGYSLKAGERALADHTTEQALTYFEIAHANAPSNLTTRERLNLLERLGALRETLGPYREAIEAYQQGIGLILADEELARDSSLMCGYLRAIGMVYQKQEKHAEALQYFDEAAALLKRSGQEDALSLDLLNDMGWSHAAQGAFSRAEELYRQALELAGGIVTRDAPGLTHDAGPGVLSHPVTTPVAGPEGDASGVMRAHPAAGTVRTRYYQAVLAWHRNETERALELVRPVILEYEDRIGEPSGVGALSYLTQFAATLFWSLGNAERARELYEKLLPLQRKNNDVFYLLSTLVGIALIQQDSSDWEGATRSLREAYDIAERIGDQADMVGILNNLGTIQEDLGFWDEAQEHYTRSQRIAVEKDAELSLVAVLSNLAALANRRGELDEAERLLDDAQTVVGHLQQTAFTQALEMEQTRLELRRDRIAFARPHLIKAFQLNHALQDRRQRPELRLVAAELHLQAGEPEKTLVSLHPVFRDARASKTLLIAERIQGRALSRLGRQPDAVAALKRSIGHARDLRLPYELGHGLFALAAALTTIKPAEATSRTPSVALRGLSEQDLSDARQYLREARELFQRLGARHELQHAEELAERLTQLVSSSDVQSRHQGEYLSFFYELTEIVNLGLDREDIMSRVLDLVIDVTGAERGLLSPGPERPPHHCGGAEHRPLHPGGRSRDQPVVAQAGETQGRTGDDR